MSWRVISPLLWMTASLSLERTPSFLSENHRASLKGTSVSEQKAGKVAGSFALISADFCLLLVSVWGFAIFCTFSKETAQKRRLTLSDFQNELETQLHDSYVTKFPQDSFQCRNRLWLVLHLSVISANDSRMTHRYDCFRAFESQWHCINVFELIT